MKSILALLFSLIISFSHGDGRVNLTIPNEAAEPETEEFFETIDDGFDEFDYISEDGSYVICSVEGINASLSYIVAPLKVEIREGENCAQIFVDLLSEYGYDPIYSGTTEENFYLKRIGGIDTENASIPSSLEEFLINNKVGISNSISEDGVLGEFDLADGSGWIYTVNGEMPDVAMCDYIPEENDVVRLRFSLCYGADTDYYEEWGFDYGNLEILNLEEITAVIAEIGADNCYEYLDSIADFDMPREDLDAILNELLVR